MNYLLFQKVYVLTPISVVHEMSTVPSSETVHIALSNASGVPIASVYELSAITGGENGGVWVTPPRKALLSVVAFKLAEELAEPTMKPI